MGINHSRADIFVSQKFLDGSDIVAVLKKMGGKAVPGPGEDEAYEKAAHDYAQNLEDQKQREHLNYLINVDFECHNWEEFNAFSMSFEDGLSCCNCMYVCWPDLEDRKKNYRLLTTSGRVIQDEKGVRVVR